ncbi:MAG TPA: hypothetical protein VH477_11945 [Bryobacteraceae bacterium]
MQFDTALNSVWLVLSVLALANTLRARRFGTQRHAPAWLHVSGVALILAALFPYISATDDVLRIQHMHLQDAAVRHVQGNQHEPGKGSSPEGKKKSSTDALIRLYETMDTPVVDSAPEISFALFFVALVTAPVWQSITREVALKSGRSPPFVLA